MDEEELEDRDWLSETTLKDFTDEEISIMKKDFREGIIHEGLPAFSTQYLEDMDAQTWARILVGYGNTQTFPKWCFYEQLLTGDDMTEFFAIGIRRYNLEKWEKENKP